MMISVGVDVSRGGHLFTADGSANIYSHYGNIYPASSKI